MKQTESSSAFVRLHAELFVGPHREPDLRKLAGELATDAVMLGESSVTIERHGDWFVVAAPGDWLTRNTQLSLVECFHRLQRLAEYRANTNRTPVVITAFAANIFALGPEGTTIIKGCEGDLTALQAHLGARFPGFRVVAFSVLVPPE